MHLIRSDSFAGVEQYVAYVAPELVRRGHDVTVVGGEPTRMRSLLEPVGVVHRPGPSVWRVARAALDAPRPDVVHVHMTAAELAAVLTRPKLRRPIVSTLHFAGPRGGHGLRARAYDAVLRPQLAREISISHFVARSSGAPLVIWNGIPAAAPGGDDARDPVVLMAQRLEAEKDTMTGVQAWAASGLASEGWELHVAGRGAERGRLEAQARELGVGASVRWLGHVDDVHERMCRAAVFLATAPAEPFGLSVVEAMRAGLPVVAAEGGAHGELLDGDQSQLFLPRDAAQCASTLRRLAADPAERHVLGARNRQRFEHELTVEQHVSRLESVYREVAADGG